MLPQLHFRPEYTTTAQQAFKNNIMFQWEQGINSQMLLRSSVSILDNPFLVQNGQNKDRLENSTLNKRRGRQEIQCLKKINQEQEELEQGYESIFILNQQSSNRSYEGSVSLTPEGELVLLFLQFYLLHHSILLYEINQANMLIIERLINHSLIQNIFNMEKELIR